MTERIAGFGPLGGLKDSGARKTLREIEGGQSPTFADLLKEQIGKVNDLQLDADKTIQDLVTGKTDNIAEVMTAVEKADLAFKTMMQVRNKLLSAYREIIRMQV